MMYPMIIHSFRHFLLFFSLFSLNSATSYASEVSYSEHCSLIVPESIPKENTNLLLPLGQFHSDYGGGRGIFNQTFSYFSKSFVFRTRNSYSTNNNHVFKVEADFLFPVPYMSDLDRNIMPGMGKDLIRLWLDGFWSESSGKLCMIGSSRLKGSVFHSLKAVLRLDNIKNSSNVLSLINGTLECLGSSDGGSYCFEPISILMYPHMNYEYTLVPKQSNIMNDLHLPLSSSMAGPRFCNEGWWPPNGFNLKYEEYCDSANSCSPFDDYVPLALFISGFDCSYKEQRLRVLVEFSKKNFSGFYDPFYPNTTLVGEGCWDEKELSIVACRLLNAAESLANAHIADCSIRLSLSFSDTLSIRETSNVVGKIWTNKTLKHNGYFSRIMFYSSENRIVGVPGLKYEYTETGRMKNLCTKTLTKKHNEERYTNGNSIHMRFDMFVSSPKGKVAWGYAIPFSVGDRFYEKHLVDEANYAVEAIVNMSYKIELTLLPGANLGEGIFHLTKSPFPNEVEISAEGIYYEKSGSLCMVGCMTFEWDNQTDSLDCEILLKFQFLPLKKHRSEGYIKGRIESLRIMSDPLYFDPLETSSVLSHSNNLISKNLICHIALISSTFSCLFVGLQCFHAKMQPESLPLMSTFMLSILTLGHLIPFMINLGTLFLKNADQQKHSFLGIGECLEANHVIIVCLVKIIAFFFQFHLLKLNWIARSSDERRKGLWVAEKNTLLVCIPIYASMVLMKWGKEGLNLKTCGEMVLIGFLLPQIVLNILRHSKENVLSFSFYIGTTFIQLLPHIFNLYKAYAFALPFSIWEFIFILEGFVFGSVIYLQQSFIL